MNIGKFQLLCAASLVAATSFGENERSVKVQNSVRVGYDDNIYASSSDEQDSAFVTDIVNLTGKMNFSSRTDLLLYWQPEVRYRVDADQKTEMYHDLYGRLNHAISQGTFLQISDRLRYQDKDGRSYLGQSDNQNYFENDLKGSLDFTVNSLSQVKVGGGYEFRTWDDSDYGQWNSVTKTGGNDYDAYVLDGSYVRELRPNTSTGVVGVNYTDLSYDGSRGGYKSTSLFGGVDQNFNPNLSGNARVGLSMNALDGTSGSDNTTTPYLQTGLEYSPSARTTLTGTMGYSVYRSQSSYFNANDQLSIALGARHDLTGKISVSSSLGYTHSIYDTEYAINSASGDATEDYVKFSVRGSYQINRNNFVDAGYEFTTRATDSALLSEYDRNRVDLGWRLRL